MFLLGNIKKNIRNPFQREMMRSSFHFPLHRYLAAFTYQAVRHTGMSLKDILPSADSLTLLMMHPLRVQVSDLLLFL